MSEAPSMTMEAELTKHQVKELQQEIEDLKIQLETKVGWTDYLICCGNLQMYTVPSVWKCIDSHLGKMSLVFLRGIY